MSNELFHIYFTSKVCQLSTVSRVRKERSLSRIPASFSRESRIPGFLAIPNIVFFSNPAYVPKKGKQSRFSGSSQIPYAVNVSRIPPCILAKSPILIIPFQTPYIHNFRTPGELFYLCAINLHRQRPPSISASKVAHVTVNRNLLRTKLQRVHLAFGRTTDLQKRKFVLFKFLSFFSTVIVSLSGKLQ